MDTSESKVVENNSPNLSPEEEEIKHFLEVATSFQEYELYTLLEINRRENHIRQLCPEYLARLPPQTFKKIEALEGAARVNQAFLDKLISSQAGFGPCPIPSLADSKRGFTGLIKSTAANQSKMRTTLLMCVRDWSAEGARERENTYNPCLEELQLRLPITASNINKQRVLCPGVGLGRLALEIVSKGYACQGNEFSYQMLMTSNYILNCLDKSDAHAIFPFIDNPNNIVAIKNTLRKITIPDIPPNDLLAGISTQLNSGESPDFSMAAGEFLEVYHDQVECWDAIVTCYFLDTAPVPIEYVEAFERLLKPGGVWINFGPLLYHWSAMKGEDLENGDLDPRYRRSVELSWEELKHVILSYGFCFAQEQFRECCYTADMASMMRTVYNCLFFTAIKPQYSTQPPA